MKIKLRRADTIFSKIIRKQRPVCELCKSRPSKEVHHYYTRRKEATRFDTSNACALCFLCHKRFHSDPDFDRKQWMIDRIGEDAYNLLRLTSNSYKKRDDKMDLIVMKAWAKEEGVEL